MKLTEVTAYNLKSEAILTESQSWEMLTEQQKIYVGSWEKNVWPLVEQYSNLMEADIKPEEIQKIFTQAEKVSIEGGENLTALGKAGKVTAEVSGKMKTEIDKLMAAAANSGPVKNFDAQFEKLKAQLKTKLQGNPAGQKILGAVDKWGGFAKDNPAKSAFIIGAMTSVLAFASGGILSGAAIGFFLKLANNTIKGDKLSTAVAKGVKGAALGAVAGALGGAIKDLLPGEVTQTLINSASGEIDVDGLSAMDATSITDLDPESAKDLVQTRGALAEILKSDLDADATELAKEQLAKLDAKILELAPDAENLKGAIDQVQSEFDIKGTDTEITKYGDEVKDADGVGTGEIETEVVAKIDAEQLNANGINSADYPDNEWVTANTEKLLDAGLTQENIDEIQRLQGLDRAIAQDEFLGVNMSAESSIQVGDDLQADGVPENVKVGEVFKSSVTKTLDDGTVYGGNATVSIEGVDADGNIVYKLESATMMPNSMTKELEQILENLPDGELKDTIWGDVLNPNTSGSMTTDIDTTLQKIAQATAAVAIGGALAKSEYVEEPKADAKKESKVYKNAEQLEEQYFYDLEDYILNEIDIKQMAKKAAAGAANIGKAAAKGAGKVAGMGMDKVGAAANKGIGKAVGAVKSGAAKAGKELGQKVTTRKLNKAWTKAGEPTDIGSITNILSAQGLSDEQIGTVAKDTGQPLKKDPNAGGQDPEGETGSTASSGGVKGGKDDKAKSSPDPKADKDGDGKPDGDSASTLQGKASGDPYNDGPFDMKSSPPKGTNAGATQDDFEWKGAQWVSTSTGKVADKATAAKLGNPKINELIREIQKAKVEKLVVDYLAGSDKKPAGKPAVTKTMTSKAAKKTPAPAPEAGGKYASIQ